MPFVRSGLLGRLLAKMGACCSCFDAITGGKHSGESSQEMTTRNSAGGVPPASHGLSRAMSAPTISIQGFRVSGSGLALTRIPVEQDAAYWEIHVHMPGQAAPSGDEDGDLQDVDVNDDGEEDPYAVKFGVATRKDREFYRSLETVEEEGDQASSHDDGTFLMRPISNLRHGDVIGVAVQQSDLPMIQILLNGEPLLECIINRFRGTVYPAVYMPAGAGGEGERVDDEGMSLNFVFDEEEFKEMSPHARFGPLLVAQGII